MQVEPYLFFDGRCEEALEFYRDAIGAELKDCMRFEDAPSGPDSECSPLAENARKIMHCSFKVGEQTLMASDGQCGGQPKFEGISLTLSVASVEEAQNVFKALSEGGNIQMPLQKTFYSPSFGMLADKFGVPWMVIVA